MTEVNDTTRVKDMIGERDIIEAKDMIGMGVLISTETKRISNIKGESC